MVMSPAAEPSGCPCYKAAVIGQSLIDGQEVHKVKLSSQIWHGMWLKLATKYKSAGPKEILNVKKVDHKFVKKVMKKIWKDKKVYE